MSLRPSDVYDAIRDLTDLIRQEPDLEVRVNHLAVLADTYEREFVTLRDATAYALRQQCYTLAEIAEAFGVERHTVTRWSADHAKRAGVRDVRGVRRGGFVDIAVIYRSDPEHRE